jgi:hypothetical protein
VFFDPDNGMEVRSRRKGRKASSKYLWPEPCGSHTEGAGKMLGSIAGDVIGSIYERHPIKTKQFPLFDPGCRASSQDPNVLDGP